jgi:HSP20 family molecular chaperone IbpA
MRNQEMFSVSDFFNDVFRALDQNIGMAWVPNDFNLYACGFPPVNVTINEDTKALTLQFAVAGFKEDNIDVNFSDDKLILTIKPNEDPDPKEKFIRRGIKSSASTASYEIPFSKYDVDSAVADLNDGILQVKIPCKKEALPKKVLISKKN